MTDLRDQLSARGISEDQTFESVMDRHLARRSVLKGMFATGALMTAPAALLSGSREAGAATLPISFDSVPDTTADTVTVPPATSPTW